MLKRVFKVGWKLEYVFLEVYLTANDLEFI